MKKKNNKWRIVQDFRSINKLTKKDARAGVIMAELVDHMGGKKLYSAMDLWTGYWQWMLQYG